MELIRLAWFSRTGKEKGETLKNEKNENVMKKSEESWGKKRRKFY